MQTVTTKAAPQPALPNVVVKNNKGSINFNLPAPAILQPPYRSSWTEMSRPQYLMYNSVLCIFLDIVHKNLLNHLHYLLFEPRNSKRYKEAFAVWEYFYEEHKDHTTEDIYDVLLYCNSNLSEDAKASGVYDASVDDAYFM